MADLPTSFFLTVVTRERKILETDAVELVLPAYDGEIGVLPGHAPLLTLLKVGVMRYRTNGTSQSLVISWGFAEILPERVIVMAETARLPQEIDASAAERRGRSLARAAGLSVDGQPSVRAAGAGGWSIAWSRVVDGTPVRGDGIRVSIRPDGTFHGLARTERPIAAVLRSPGAGNGQRRTENGERWTLGWRDSHARIFCAAQTPRTTSKHR